MPFLDTTSHLTTKPYSFDIKCPINSESYDQHGFFGTKLRGGQNLLLMVEGFFNERKYSGADWLVPFICQSSQSKIQQSIYPPCDQSSNPSNVKAILKAMINMDFLGPSLGGVRIFYYRWEVFPTRESTLGLTGWTLS